MKMKTLIIGDIHNHIHGLEDFIESVEHDEVVFLGDYFDSFHDTHEHAENTARWLKESLTKPNRIHLFGNHDLPYCFPENRMFNWCPGPTKSKRVVINEVLTKDDWKKLKFHHIKDRFLFLHAGLHTQFVNVDWQNGVSMKELDVLLQGEFDSVWKNPKYESDLMDLMGIFWIRPELFTPIPHVVQIHGHTQVPRPMKTSENEGYIVNFDCFANWYGILGDDRRLLIKHKTKPGIDYEYEFNKVKYGNDMKIQDWT